MAKRRGNGEGSIFYNEKLTRWVGQFSNGITKEGTPNRKAVYGKTRKEVISKMTKALNEVQEKKFVDKSGITLVEIIKEIVEDKHNANKTSDTTYRRDLQTIKIINNSDISKKPIQKITNTDLKRFFTSITDYANHTIDMVYRLINNAYNKAVFNKLLYFNLLDNKDEIIKPISNKLDRKVEALTTEQHKKIIEVLCGFERNHPYKNVVLLMLTTGMRIGEILALSISDINLSTGYIHIHTSLTRDKQDKVIMGNKTKTYNSVRDIKMLDSVEKIIEKELEKHQPNKYNLLFWDYKKDTFITPCEVNSYLSRLNKKYDIAPHIHNHMLRHTYATRCIESGMSPSVLQKKLGHKDISITLNTYTSVFTKFEDTQDDKYIKYMKQENIQIC